MSFDLVLLRMPADASKREIRAAAAAAVNARPLDTPPDSAIEARKRAVADAMLVMFPELEEKQLDYAEIARKQGITEDEARARIRWISLNGPKDAANVEIDLRAVSWSMIQSGKRWSMSPPAQRETVLCVLMRSGRGGDSGDTQLRRTIG